MARPKQPLPEILEVAEASGAAGVTAADRFTFASFLATVLHAALVLGLTFTYAVTQSSSRILTVTIAQHSSKEAPEQPDYLAQWSQTGSGTLEEKKLLTSPTEADFHDTVIRETTPFTEDRIKGGEAPDGSANLIATITPQPEASTQDTGEGTSFAGVEEATPGDLLMAKALEIASLEARLDSLQQVYAKRPRIKRLTSVSTTNSADAAYVKSWRRKVETIGNLNYPEEARRKQIYGSLRLLVALLPDGRVKEIDLLESSGHPELDAAAIRIVRLAAPFAPFPDQLRQTTDILEIIRTYKFRKNDTLGSF